MKNVTTTRPGLAFRDAVTSFAGSSSGAVHLK